MNQPRNDLNPEFLSVCFFHYTIIMLVLYGVPASQPVRSVLWALVMKQVPHKFQFTMPRSTKPGGAQHIDYLRLNPFGAVPCLTDGEVVVYEGAAILCYLADRHAWADLYPRDLPARALVDQYLHWHHGNTRQLTMALVRPLLVGTPYDAALASTADRILMNLEIYIGSKDFLCGEGPTVADLLAYGDLGQLQSQFLDLVDFSAYPKLEAWLSRMRALPGHDEAHEGFTKFLGHPKYRDSRAKYDTMVRASKL